jgi:AcrR family transcriptional regulator
LCAGCLALDFIFNSNECLNVWSMGDSTPDTKSRILDVAEELFSEQGLDRVSVRNITDAARVNIASVSYHFGGKEELIAAVFERRISPVNQARVAALDALEVKGRTQSPKVEQIMEAFIRPAVECCHGDEKGAKAFGKLFGRCLAETRPELEEWLRKQFQPVASRMEKTLCRALPHLSRADIFWRMKFTFGALHHWMLTRDKFLPDWARKTGVEEQMAKLVAFAAAGFKAK